MFCMTCSAQFNSQPTRDAEDIFLYFCRIFCPVPPVHIFMDMLWGGRTLLRYVDIAVVHRWLVGDFPLMVNNQTMG